MKVKEVDKTVNVAWSPEQQHPIYLAAGTAAQQLDASFNTTASLDIFALNLTEPGLDFELKCSIPTENRFHKITWGGYNYNSDTPQGMIIGGCDDGIIQIYNANKVLNGQPELHLQTKKHTGPVRALDFNNFQKHLFASGASDSEIFVWDLLHSGGPINTPLGTKIQPSEDIVCLSWNNQVQHILASVFPSKCVIWDLRKGEPIIKVTDSSVGRFKWKSVTWNPDIATQLCLASEDDQSPVVEIWDLRFATAPIKVLHGYNKGVMSVNWCPKDSELLLGCGKDDHVICWNPSSPNPDDEVVCRVQTNSQWNFDVSWCPRYPNLYAVSSFDGHMGVYSITGGQYQGETKTKIADSFPGMESYAETSAPIHQVVAELKKAPKWLKRPAGASFGFGGKLITFSSDNRSIIVNKIVTDTPLMERSRALEQTLEAREFPAYCTHKIGTVSDSQEQQIWRFVSAHFDTDPRSQFLSLLGYSNDALHNKLNEVRGYSANSKLLNDLSLKNSEALGNSLHNNNQYLDEDSNTTNFNKLPSVPAKIQFNTNEDEMNGLLQKALLLGNIPEAVNICIEENLLAEAIILASAGGPDLLAKTHYRFFQLKKETLSSLIGAVVTHDWRSIVENCDISAWTEVLVAILTYAQENEIDSLCELLGKRLEEQGGSLAVKAELCYVTSGNINKLVDSWIKVNGKSSNNIQDLVEVVLIIQKALQTRGKNVVVSGEFAELLSSYASLLAAQGDLETALSYLKNSNDEKIISLKQRCERALNIPNSRQRSVSGNYYSTKRSSLPASNRPNAYQQPQVSNTFSPPVANIAAPPMMMPTQSQQTPLTPTCISQNLNSGIGPVPNQPSFVPQSHFPSSDVGGPPVAPPPATPVPFSRTSASPGPAGVMSRSKYLVDPSVLNSPPANSYYSSQSSTMNSSGYPQYPQYPMSRPPSSMGQPMTNSQLPPSTNQMGNNMFQPIPGGHNQVPASFPHESTYNGGQPQRQPPPPPSMSSNGQTAYTYTAAPGWNDPPPLMAAPKPINKVEKKAAPPPITHPLFGTAAPNDPQQQHFQNIQQNQGFMQQQQQPPPQFNSNSMYTGDVAHQPYFRNPVAEPSQPTNNLPPIQQATEATPLSTKAVLPVEHMHIQTVFDELRSRCYSTASSAISKKKLEDVARKLELLYDALRDSKLSSTAIQNLHQLVQFAQQGDYNSAFVLHSQMVSGSDFSNIASFMPALKILFQLALQLGVYIN